MLTGQSSVLTHRGQNAALLLLSLAVLPLTTFILQASLLIDWMFPSRVTRNRRAARSKPGFLPKQILVTGVGMTKGLAIARLFYEAGHDVTGADFEPTSLPTACGRVSRSLKKFYRVARPVPARTPSQSSSSNADPYIASLLAIVRTERIDLWISCSGVASAVEDGLARETIEARTPCRAVQFDVATTQTLHEKDRFIARTRELGLLVPETHSVTSRGQVEALLRAAPRGTKYIMKTVGVDDGARGDMTLLPRATARLTAAHVARLRISPDSPWILQRFVAGPEYCTHAVVVDGVVRAFVACPGAELLMHYVALPAHSPLSRAMLDFTRTFAAAYGKGFTGHLSFDFLVDEANVEAVEPGGVTLYPIECNPRAHTAVCLFEGTGEMVDAYLSALERGKNLNGNGSGNGNGIGKGMSPSWGERVVFPKHDERKYYWIGHDLVELVLLPLVRVMTLQGGVNTLVNGVRTFVEHVLFWHDGTYELWDPLPAWWLYHVYWPVQFAVSLWEGSKWSRINVSTTKVFGC